MAEGKVYLINLSQIPFVLDTEKVKRKDDWLFGTLVFHRKCIEYYAFWPNQSPPYTTGNGRVCAYYEPPKCRIPFYYHFKEYKRPRWDCSPCYYYVTGAFNVFKPRPEIKEKYGDDVVAWREIVTPFGRGIIVVRQNNDQDNDKYTIEVVKDVAIPLTLADEKRYFYKPNLKLKLSNDLDIRVLIGAQIGYYYDDEYRAYSIKTSGGKLYCSCEVGGFFAAEKVRIREIPLEGKFMIKTITTYRKRDPETYKLFWHEEEEKECYSPIIEEGAVKIVSVPCE